MRPIARRGAEHELPDAGTGLHARASSPHPRSSHPAPATIGGRYRVLSELGRGGMGVVYHVVDPGSGQQLALKQLLLRGHAQHTKPSVSLFEHEYHTLAQLAHPRVIAVHDYGLDPAGPYYTMELLDGGDLKALAPLDVERTCRLMLELCSSLALLHARRLVHRDISPRNVRCTRDGHAKLIDFGAMVPMGPCTHTVGTPAFVAPEVLHRSNIDARTDLFSLGATLYYTLTGRPPFAARQFSDLREAWAAELMPPSRLVPGIPPALDALCASLLRIDPAQRPRSAFEVMQRLQAIAGIEHSEPLEVRRAYLTAPALIGRDAPLRAFRQRMRRALHGDGGVLAFESAPGLGRSRMLDACALEAKTLGAIVLRAAASTSAERAFAVAELLAVQLVLALPEAAPAAAKAAGVYELLFEPPNDAREQQRAGTPRLRSIAGDVPERGTLQAALRSWLAQVCKTHALLIAVDDAPRVDEPSIALLAELALAARELRLLLAITVEAPGSTRAPPAFTVLAEQCTQLSLPALSRAETEALLGSVFDDAPQLQLLADRVHKVALGSPREALELAQHLVSTGRIRYDDGRWSLPAELSAADLPQSATEALQARIPLLPALARSLAQAHALLGNHVLRREDYAALSPQTALAELDAALLSLLAHEVLQSDGALYSLSHRALADALRASLDGASERELHQALFALRQGQADSHPYLTVHHLLAAGREQQALDLLAQTPIDDAAATAAVRCDPSRLVATIERALELSLSTDRPARETSELRRRLTLLVVLTDDAPYARIAPAFVAQLERDSGLADYRALDPALPAAERLQQALGAATARYASTPEQERVYRADEAIKHLATFAMVSIVVVARGLDRRLLRSLPGLLEPFAPLSPLLDALLRNVEAQDAAVFQGRPLEARRLWTEVYERMSQVQGETVPYARSIHGAVAHAIGRFEATLGRPSALLWAEKLDAHPLMRVSAMHVRRLARLMQGDAAGAERFAREAELLALRSSTRQMFERPWQIELLASVLCRDLEGITRAIDGIVPLASRHPGWVPLLRVAQGHFHLLRGAHAAACDAFEDGVRLAAPDNGESGAMDFWLAAIAGLISTWCELGQVERAIELGTKTLARCEALGVSLVWHKVACALALAEAQAQHIDAARARLDALIAEQQQLELHGLSLAASHDARARVAIAERDGAGAAQHAALALRERGGQDAPATAAHTEGLLEAARNAGVEVALAPTDFEVSVLGTQRSSAPDPVSTRVGAALAACGDARSRAEHALELLCDVACAAGGQLYLADQEGRLAHAAARNAAAPDAELAQFVRGFFAQQLDDENLSAGLTHATHMQSLPGAASFIDSRGREHRLLLLSCKDQGRLVYAGLAVLAAERATRVAPELLVLSATLASCLLRAGDAAGTRVAD